MLWLPHGQATGKGLAASVAAFTEGELSRLEVWWGWWAGEGTEFQVISRANHREHTVLGAGSERPPFPSMEQ